MSTLTSRLLLVNLARRDLGIRETSHNRGQGIAKFWPATSYPEGYVDRQPYCAAALCYWVQQWLTLPAVQKDFGKTSTQLESWRCKSAKAWAWEDWARKKGLLILSDSPKETLHTGDIMVMDISHIALVVDDSKDRVFTIEANTNPAGSREGGGVYEMDRPRSLARCFIRLLP